MILKEISFDFPYVPADENINDIISRKGISREEATRLDYQENWKWNRREYSLQTRCITSLFERLLPKVNTNGIWKVLIECVQTIREEEIKNYSGVLSIEIEFDLIKFLDSTELDKQKTTLDILMRTLKRISSTQEWNYSIFEEVEKEIKRLKYQNEWIWKRTENNELNLFAEVLCKHSVQNLDLFLLIRDQDGLLKKEKKVLSEQPDEFAYARHLGSLQWIKNTAQLTNKEGKVLEEISC